MSAFRDTGSAALVWQHVRTLQAMQSFGRDELHMLGAAQGAFAAAAREEPGLIMDLLRDQHLWVRRIAIFALGDAHSAECVDALVRQLQIDPENQVAIIEALGKIGGPSALMAIQGGLNSSDAFVRETAIASLLMMKAAEPALAIVTRLEIERDRSVVRKTLANLLAIDRLDLLIEHWNRLPEMTRFEIAYHTTVLDAEERPRVNCVIIAALNDADRDVNLAGIEAAAEMWPDQCSMSQAAETENEDGNDDEWRRAHCRRLISCLQSHQ